MGIYLNPDNGGFSTSVKSKIYVDKTELISCINEAIDTEDKFVCVSRLRRFGKSMAAKMLVAYYFQRKVHIYNPRSIVQAMMNREFENYWTQTETYEGLKSYIDLNYDGLKDAIISMIGGGQCKVDTSAFQNDMTSFKSKDDILTLLVHLGYLAYDKYCKEVYIPNEEIKEEFIRAVKNGGWGNC